MYREARRARRYPARERMSLGRQAPRREANASPRCRRLAEVATLEKAAEANAREDETHTDRRPVEEVEEQGYDSEL